MTLCASGELRMVGMLHLVFGDKGYALLPVDAPQVGSAFREHAFVRHREFEDFGGVAAEDQVDFVLGSPVVQPYLEDLGEHPAPVVRLIAEHARPSAHT